MLPFYVLIFNKQESSSSCYPLDIFCQQGVFSSKTPLFYETNSFSKFGSLLDPWNIFYISPRIGMTFPSLITCFGNLFKNYYFDIGSKSLSEPREEIFYYFFYCTYCYPM